MSRNEAKKLLQKLELNSRKRLLKPTSLTSSSTTLTPALCRLVISYNTPREGAGQDSKGILSFIKTYLESFAKSKPFLEIVVIQKSGKPSCSFYYSAGDFEVIETPRQSSEEILKLVEKYSSLQALKNVKRYYPRPVKSKSLLSQEWNPFNTHVIFRP